MKKEKENELMVWKFQWWENFGFFIPTDRDSYGWDFFIAKENFWLAQDWDKVEARELKKSKWKKPEAKIIKVYWRTPQAKPKFIEWIYSGWDGNFGFIDVEWVEKWFFVYGNKKNWAKDWDKVKAEIVDFNWRKEAVIVKVFETKEELIIWKYRDNDKFGFVIPENNSNLEEKKWTTWDIFIAWWRKNWAKSWDKVEVKIVKKWWKNPEWIITKILN